MTPEEQEAMDRYGITVEEKCVYTYRGYRYDRLQQAVDYAKTDALRRVTSRGAPEQIGK